MTVGAHQAIRASGLRAPDDVSLVTMDDPFWAALNDPPLTALGQPVKRMADAPARPLFERIDGIRDQTRIIVFGFERCVRVSCGALAVKGGSLA